MSGDGGRQYAQILKRIWSDPDWKALSRDAQWLYQLLLSQPSMNYAGVLPLTVRRWSHLAAGTSPADIEAALDELSAANFVVVDRDSEEVLVRSFIRNDELWKQPNMLVTAIRNANDVVSESLRWALHDELLRIPAHGRRGTLENEANALVTGYELRDSPSHSRRDSRTPSEGIPASGGVGGYVSTEGGAPHTSATFNPTGIGSVSPESHLREGERENAPRPRGPAVDADGWKLVREIIPVEHPQASKTALAIEAGTLLKAGTPCGDIRAALGLWLDKPNLGPRTLPSLVSEVIRTRAGPSAAGGHAVSTTDLRMAQAQALKRTSGTWPAGPMELT